MITTKFHTAYVSLLYEFIQLASSLLLMTIFQKKKFSQVVHLDHKITTLIYREHKRCIIIFQSEYLNTNFCTFVYTKSTVDTHAQVIHYLILIPQNIIHWRWYVHIYSISFCHSVIQGGININLDGDGDELESGFLFTPLCFASPFLFVHSSHKAIMQKRCDSERWSDQIPVW